MTNEEFVKSFTDWAESVKSDYPRHKMGFFLLSYAVGITYTHCPSEELAGEIIQQSVDFGLKCYLEAKERGLMES